MVMCTCLPAHLPTSIAHHLYTILTIFNQPLHSLEKVVKEAKVEREEKLPPQRKLRSLVLPRLVFR
jgi:hypothetical protein